VYASTEDPSNDPVNYSIEGRVDSSSRWVEISSGDFDSAWMSDTVVPQRNTLTPNPDIDSTRTEGDTSKSFGYANFQNDEWYLDYRVSFKRNRFDNDDEEYSEFVISELELPGYQGVASVIGPSTTLTSDGCNTSLGPNRGDAHLRDGQISNFACSRDQGAFPPELVLTQGDLSRVTGIRVYANTGPLSAEFLFADPITYSIEGRLGSNDDWELISEGPFNEVWFNGMITGPPPARNTFGEPIDSSYLEGDTTKSFGFATFENTVVYRDYRVIFPRLRRSPPIPDPQPIQYIQFIIAELELPGVLISVAPSINTQQGPTSAPSVSFQPSKHSFPRVRDDGPITVQNDQPKSFDVIANDEPAYGRPMFVSEIVDPGNKGNCAIVTSLVFPQNIIYTPDPGSDGIDTCTYKACDTSNECSQDKAFVTINIA